MNRNWKQLILIAMFVLQTASVFFWDHSFKRGMGRHREMVMQDSGGGKAAAQHAASLAPALLETEYQVSSYVRNALWMSLMFNFGMLLVAISERHKDESIPTRTSARTPGA